MATSYGRQETLIRLIEKKQKIDRIRIITDWSPGKEVVGICTRSNCGYVRDVPQDAINDWCESCEAPSVVSLLVLLGLVELKEVDSKKRRR